MKCLRMCHTAWSERSSLRREGVLLGGRVHGNGVIVEWTEPAAGPRDWGHMAVNLKKGSKDRAQGMFALS